MILEDNQMHLLASKKTLVAVTQEDGINGTFNIS
jgi:hypothetical protein